MIFGPFEKCFHEGTFWRGPRAVIPFIFTTQIFFYLYRHGDGFYKRYINKISKTKYLDHDGSGVIFFGKNRNKTFIQLQFNRRNVAKISYNNKRQFWEK